MIKIFTKISIVSFAIMAIGCSSSQPKIVFDPNTLNGALPNVEHCSETISIKYNNLSDDLLNITCDSLLKAHAKFNEIFNDQPALINDYSDEMQVVIYDSRQHYVALANKHFLIPTDNIGLLLDGKFDVRGNVVKYVTYNDHNKIHNVVHEFTHYLDGRYNLAGAFCDSLHDDRNAPNFCLRQTPTYPHLVWWSEGLAQYITFGDNYKPALDIAHEKTHQLSDLFDTSYNRNGGEERINQYGYLAVRYMLEHHRNRIERMLNLLRAGKYKAYQKMARSWGRSMDQDFSRWLSKQ